MRSIGLYVYRWVSACTTHASSHLHRNLLHTPHTLTHCISTVYIYSCVTGTRLRGVHHLVRHYRACTRGARVVETGLVKSITTLPCSVCFSHITCKYIYITDFIFHIKVRKIKPCLKVILKQELFYDTMSENKWKQNIAYMAHDNVVNEGFSWYCVMLFSGNQMGRGGRGRGQWVNRQQRAPFEGGPRGFNPRK